MRKVVDIIGHTYGLLRVVGFDRCENKRSYWVCECECKKIVVLRKDHFAYAYSKQKSCGCLRNAKSSERMKEWHRMREATP